MTRQHTPEAKMRPGILSALAPFFAVLIALTIFVASAPAQIDPTNRTVTTSSFVVAWSTSNDTEAVTSISWMGGQNLTNTQGIGTCFPSFPGSVEYFGNSYAPPDPWAGGLVLVGGGTTTPPGTTAWSGQILSSGTDQVTINSSSTGCPPSSGINVQTTYSFQNPEDSSTNSFGVQRAFDFTTTAFAHDFRPYMPRLSLSEGFTEVLYPDTSGALATLNVYDCDLGCTGPIVVPDATSLNPPWNATQGWFAIHNPSTLQGVVVKRNPSVDPQGNPIVAQLWVDNDEDSDTGTNVSSFLLMSPTAGFTGGMVTEVETLCFYNSSIWTPSLTPPAGCGGAPASPTSSTLTSSLNPSNYGQSVILTAAVSASSGTPTGNVVFTDTSTSTTLGSATLVSGTASISVSSLAAGTHSITATYQGSPTFAASTSTPLTQTVNAATTATTLTSSLNPANTNQAITFTATVAGEYGGAATGSVTFYSGTQSLGTASLSGNRTTLGTSFSTAGTYSISATYKGDANNAGSTSSVLTQVINTSTTTRNPVPFLNQPLVPDATAPGGAGFTLTVNGAWFIPASAVNWNGSPIATTFVNSAQLTAAVPASDLTTASTASVTVVNPSPGGGVSNIQYFSIVVPKTSVSFLPAVTYDSGGYIAQGVAIADVNGDGKPDIVVSNWWDAGNTHGLIGVLLGKGDGTFQPVVTYESGEAPDDGFLVVADVNGDGKPDIIVTSCAATASTCGSAPGVVSVLLGNGDGTFQSAVSYSSGAASAVGLAVADIDGDGNLDLIVTNGSGGKSGDGTVAVLLNNGKGAFGTAVLYDSGSQVPNMVAVADVNGDGIPDVLVANRCDSCAGGILSVLIGNGDGTFQPAVTYPSGGQNTAWIAVSDLNRDGKPDVVLSNLNLGDPNGTVSVLLGAAGGTFQPAVTYESGGYAAAGFTIADVNGDGHPDIVVANCGPVTGCGTGVVGVLLGRGDGTFESVSTFSSGAYNATDVAAADLTGDGKVDVVATNQYGGANGDASLGVLLNPTSSSCLGKCSTYTALASNLNPSTHGQAITFTATVTSSGGAPPNGEAVTFFNGSNVLGTAPLAGGSASLATSKLQSGVFTISATYLGDANFTASTSPALEQVVDTPSQSPTATTLASSLNSSLYGQKVTWTATVTTSGSTTPTGKVNFIWQGTAVGSASLNASGVATLTRSNLNADSYPLTAVYVGDANNGPSASPILNQVVQQTTSAATISSSLNPSTQGQAVTFTAKITSPTTTPTGPVTFTAGTTVLGSVELSKGEATLTTSALPVGSTTVTVTYPWNSDIAESSASVIQVVQQ